MARMSQRELYDRALKKFDADEETIRKQRAALDAVWKAALARGVDPDTLVKETAKVIRKQYGADADNVMRALFSDVAKAEALGMEPSLFTPGKTNASTIVGPRLPIGEGTWVPVAVEESADVSKARARLEAEVTARGEQIGRNINKVRRDIEGGGIGTVR